MTQVRSKFVAIIAAMALAIGCALVATTPQKALAEELTLGTTVGTTTAAATNMPLVGKSLQTTAYATFNRTNDNHWYKFTTSDRNSNYRIRLEADSPDGTIFFTVYDSGMHRFFTSQLATTGRRTINLTKLTRNQVYYVEIWRFAVDSPQYKGTQGQSDVQYADYRLLIKELVQAPDPVQNLRVSSPSTKKLKVKYRKARYASAYQILVKNSVDNKKYYFRTKKTTWTLKTKYTGRYRVWVRPYRVVNNKTYYGQWNPYETNANGKVRFRNGVATTVKG